MSDETAIAKVNDFDAFTNQLAVFERSFGDEFEAVEQAEQLFPDSLRLNETNVGLSDGGVLRDLREVKTSIGTAIVCVFERPDHMRFEVIFPKRIVVKMQEEGWGINDVIAFQWRGYVKVGDGKKNPMKNIAVVRLGTVGNKPAAKGKKEK